MRLPRLSKLELQIMDALWSRGASSVREIQEAFPEKGRPAYTTVQTMVYRLEDEGRDPPREEDRERPHLRGRRLARPRPSAV